MASKKKTACCVIAIVVAVLIAMTAAGIAGYFIYKYYKGSDTGESKITVKLSDSLENFSSNKEFDDYAKKLEKDQEESWAAKLSESLDTGLGFGLGDTDSTVPQSAEKKSSDEGDSESITNVQETGVDEGDIVKTYKDYFVILRRGRIFTVKNSESGDNTLKKVSQVNAYPSGYTGGTWYDEMLIKDGLVMVIGYSYSMSATEVGLFNISSQGQLKHVNTYFIDSNDYYSSRNYASRLVDDKLIFYMPYYLFSWNYDGGESKREMKLPQIKQWQRGDETSNGKDILKKTDIYKPVQDITSPTLHTVVSCDIASGDLDCSAKAILGPYSRNFYVSPNAIYTWVSDVNYNSYDESDSERADEPGSFVYMMKIDDMSARALRADGTPIDQFSFKEQDDHLNVLVREYSAGDAMWNPETTSGEMALFRVPLNKFSNKPTTAAKDSYTALPAPEGYTLQNRYVGDYLLYGAGSSWYQDNTAKSKLYAKKFASTEETKTVELAHSVDRIDIIGDGAIVVGSDYTDAGSYDLKFSSIELKRSLSVQSTYTVPSATQGELRSHGFSYKAQSGGVGILGLPIRKQGQSYEHLFNESAEVLFLKVDADKNFSKLGALQAKPSDRIGSSVDEVDNCEYSCVDWYGNSRPIFYKDRILALMGYEMVEGEISGDSLTEAKRLNFAP
ncbi:MAG: beta-propeller domain-containing protein [Parcubacteria group bacterium]|nr:beta-propeller domain-containing protein [Parcubacteria group bacterium]